MTTEYTERLRMAGHFIRPAIRQAMDALPVAAGSHGLDAGCGIGAHTRLLAHKVGPDGRVTGIDLAEAHVEAARHDTTGSPVASRVAYLQGDVFQLPFEDDTFDWAWCSDTLWPGFGDKGNDAPRLGIAELTRVVRPGGIVALNFWSSQALLAGYPILEAELERAYTYWNPSLGKVPPDLHFLRAHGWLRGAGLEQPTVRTFVAEAQAPLSPELRESLGYYFEMFWGEVESAVPAETWAEYRRLCSASSPDYLLDCPDYYAFVTYSLVYGQVT